jgi:hypothetical protein
MASSFDRAEQRRPISVWVERFVQQQLGQLGFESRVLARRALGWRTAQEIWQNRIQLIVDRDELRCDVQRRSRGLGWLVRQREPEVRLERRLLRRP